MLVHLYGGMASSSGNGVNNEGRSGQESRRMKRKLNSYAEPVISKHYKSLSFSEWPDWEKEALLEALKTYGHYDIDKLCKALPTKSRDNIQVVINTWWKSARMAMLASANGKKNFEEIKKKPGRRPSSQNAASADKVPIDQWLLKLENSQAAGATSQSKLLAKVFLYISKYESHPSPEECNGVDFKALYEFLYCMLNGYPGKDLNPQTSTYMLNSLREMATMLHERGVTKETSILEKTQRITGQANQVRQYGGKRKSLVKDVVEPNSDEMKFKRLLETPGLNPLNISAEVLKK